MRGEDGWDERSVYATIRMGDVDGDGTSDVCADGVHCWLWSGAGSGIGPCAAGGLHDPSASGDYAILSID